MGCLTTQGRAPVGRALALATGTLLLVVAAAIALAPSVGAATASPTKAGAKSGAKTGACVMRSNRPRSTRPADAPRPLRGICDYLEGRKGVVQVALFDSETGHNYRLQNGDNKQVTASIVKVDILARWLRDYQRRGVAIPDGIPYSITYLMGRMIDNSDNAAATSLFYFGGGCEALTQFNALIPLKATKVGCESSTYYGWGNTTTTAADQVELMKLFAYGANGILGRDARDYGLKLMQSVEPDQRFGITCGPWGTACDPPNYAQPVPGVTVALKNGWKTLPTCTKPIVQCPWQVNSTGWVRGQGRDYVLTVLTTRDPVGSGDTYGFNYGIETIQDVSRRVWGNLG